MGKDSNKGTLKFLLDMANKCGACVVEETRCPHCNMDQVHGHNFAEVLVCQNPLCRQRYASDVPRRPKAGEVTMDHLDAAIVKLHNEQVLDQHKLFPPFDAHELETLDEKTRFLVARAATAAQVIVLRKVKVLAEEYAKI